MVECGSEWGDEMRECGNGGWSTSSGRLQAACSLSLSALLQLEWGQPRAPHGHGQWPPHLTMVMVVIIIVSINIIMYIIFLGKGSGKNVRKFMVFYHTPLGHPPGMVFLGIKRFTPIFSFRNKTTYEWNKFYTWSHSNLLFWPSFPQDSAL